MYNTDFLDLLSLFEWIMLATEEEGSLLGAGLLVIAFIVLIILIWPQPIKGDDDTTKNKKRRKKKAKKPIDPNDMVY